MPFVAKAICDLLQQDPTVLLSISNPKHSYLEVKFYTGIPSLKLKTPCCKLWLPSWFQQYSCSITPLTTCSALHPQMMVLPKMCLAPKNTDHSSAYHTTMISTTEKSLRTADEENKTRMLNLLQGLIALSTEILKTITVCHVQFSPHPPMMHPCIPWLTTAIKYDLRSVKQSIACLFIAVSNL
jgi:hypothetical protein